MSREQGDTKVEYGEITTNKKLKDALLRRDKAYSHWIIETDRKILDEFVYTDKNIFRNRILPSYHYLKSIAEKGSTVAVPIIVDIEMAIRFANFEPKEQKILKMWMDGHTQAGIAEAVYEYQQNVGRVINDCVERLQYILVFLNPYI